MADRVVQTTASGASVAVDTVGSRDFQLIKLAGGEASGTTQIAATSGVPAASSVGLIVAQKAGASVTVVAGTISVSGPVQVSGTLTANGSVSLSGTGLVSVVPGVSVTIQQGASVSAVVSGTINVATVQTILSTVNVAIVAGAGGGGSVTTAQPASNATGQMVWLVGGQNATAPPVRVSGTVDVTVSVTAVVTNVTVVSTIVTILGTQAVTLVAGATISTVLGTVAVNVVAGGAAPGSTAATQTAITAQVGWLAPTQTMALVSTVATVGTLLGTVAVNVVAGGAAPGSTAATQSNISGQVMWLAPTQTINVTIADIVASSVPATSVALGLPVWIVGGQTATGVPVRVIVSTGSVGISGSVLVTVTGSVPVSMVGSVSVTGLVGISGSALVSGTITILNSQTIATQANTTGLAVWLAPTQTIIAQDAGRTRVLIVVPATSVGISGTTMSFTVQVGLSVPIAGTTSYVIPSGKTLRLLTGDMIADGSVATSPVHVRAMVLASTALPTWTTTVPYLMPIQAWAFSSGVAAYGAAGGIDDIGAGVTIGVGMTIGTSGGTIVQAAWHGFLYP